MLIRQDISYAESLISMLDAGLDNDGMETTYLGYVCTKRAHQIRLEHFLIPICDNIGTFLIVPVQAQGVISIVDDKLVLQFELEEISVHG